MKCLLALGLLSVSPALAGAQTVTPLETRVPQPVPVRELGEAISFPVPPEQNAPFNEKDDAFGRVVKRMFDAGLADPRGLEYREVELLGAPQMLRREGERVPLPRAFVLPSTDDKARFAIGWNGQIYRVTRVGELKDALADLAAMKLRPLDKGQQFFERDGGNNLDFSMPTVLKAVMAERLGAPRSLFSEIQLKGAALPFVTGLSSRARFAHLRGDDQTALALLRREKFARESLRDVLDAQTKSPYSEFGSLSSVPDDALLLLDQERRAREQLAGPTAVPSTPLDRLIDDLQNVDAQQMTLPGSVNFLDDARVRALVNKGDGAVPALIEAVASDTRLTRSMQSGGFGFSFPGQILPVSQAAYDALTEIWGVRNASSKLFGESYLLSDPGKRADVVGKLRAYAAKYRALSPLDRQFAILNDNAARVAQWLDAIETLNRAPGEMSPSFFSFATRSESPSTSNRGEALRAKTNPSVADLTERRTLEVARRALASGWPESDELMDTSNSLLLQLAKWDNARALPLFLPQIENIEQLKRAVPEDNRSTVERLEADARLRFFRASLAAPPNDYAAWLGKQPFGSLDTRFYFPLWHLNDDAAFVRVSKSLFDAPRRPFEELLRGSKTGEGAAYSALGLLGTPLLGQEPFRGAVLRELNNKTPIGALHYQDRYTNVRLASGASVFFMLSDKLSDSRAPEGAPMRVCDVVAQGINFPLPDGHREPLLQLGWPQAKRDAAIAAIIKRVEAGQFSSDRFVDY